MKLIAGQLKDMSSTDRFTITKGIFGTPGLDAGDKMIDSLANINTSIENVKDTMSDFANTDFELTTQWDLLETSITDSESTIGGVLNNIKQGFVGILTTMNNISRYGTDLSSGTIDILNKAANAQKVITKRELDAKVVMTRGGRKPLTKDSRIAIIKEKIRAAEKELNLMSILQIDKAKNTTSIGRSLGLGSDKLKKGFKDIAFKEQSIKGLKSLLKDEIDTIVKKVIQDKPKPKKKKKKKSKKSSKLIQRDLTQVSASRAVKSLTINIDSFIKGGINFETQNITESASAIEREIRSLLIKVVNEGGNQIYKNK